MLVDFLTLFQTLLNGLLLGLVLALIAGGLSLIWGVTKMINFAHGEFLMLGMYLTFWFHELAGLDPLVALPPVALVMFIVGVLAYKLLLHRVVTASFFSQFFATFGLSIALRGLAQFAWSPNYRLIRDSALYGQRLDFLGLTVGWPQLVVALGSVLTFVVLYYFIEYTETGRALQATAQDRIAAMVMGIDSEWMFALSWGIGIATVGIAGNLLTLYFPIYPDVGVVFALTSYVVVTLGGFGSILGTFLAGILIGLIQVLTALFSPALRMVAVAVVFLLVVFIRPRGLLGRS